MGTFTGISQNELNIMRNKAIAEISKSDPTNAPAIVDAYIKQQVGAGALKVQTPSFAEKAFLPNLRPALSYMAEPVAAGIRTYQSKKLEKEFNKLASQKRTPETVAKMEELANQMVQKAQPTFMDPTAYFRFGERTPEGKRDYTGAILETAKGTAQMADTAARIYALAQMGGAGLQATGGKLGSKALTQAGAGLTKAFPTGTMLPGNLATGGGAFGNIARAGLAGAGYGLMGGVAQPGTEATTPEAVQKTLERAGYGAGTGAVWGVGTQGVVEAGKGIRNYLQESVVRPNSTAKYDWVEKQQNAMETGRKEGIISGAANTEEMSKRLNVKMEELSKNIKELDNGNTVDFNDVKTALTESAGDNVNKATLKKILGIVDKQTVKANKNGGLTSTDLWEIRKNMDNLLNGNKGLTVLQSGGSPTNNQQAGADIHETITDILSKDVMLPDGKSIGINNPELSPVFGKMRDLEILRNGLQPGTKQMMVGNMLVNVPLKGTPIQSFMMGTAAGAEKIGQLSSLLGSQLPTQMLTGYVSGLPTQNAITPEMLKGQIDLTGQLQSTGGAGAGAGIGTGVGAGVGAGAPATQVSTTPEGTPGYWNLGEINRFLYQDRYTYGDKNKDKMLAMLEYKDQVETGGANIDYIRNFVDNIYGAGKGAKLTATETAAKNTLDKAKKAFKYWQVNKDKIQEGPISGRVQRGLSWINQANEQTYNFDVALSNIEAEITKARAGATLSANERALLDNYVPKITDSEQRIKTKLANLSANPDQFLSIVNNMIENPDINK